MTRVHRLDQATREAVIQALSGELALRPEVSFACVFGSFLEPDGFRDLDVAVWLAEGATGRADVDLAIRLSQVAGVPVDVRIANQAPIPFLFHVLKGRFLFVRDEALVAALIERTVRLYHDRAPLLLQATRDAFAT